MVVQDSCKKYIIRVDVSKNVVYETCIGTWEKDVCTRYHESYVNNILPLFNGVNWIKCCDLRSYYISDITDELQKYINWATSNGMIFGIFITNSSIVKLQIKKVFNLNSNIKIFKTFEAAEEFISNTLLALHPQI